MAVCGVLASLPALHLSACVSACLGPRVHACTCVQCSSAPCDMLGWEPGGFRMPVLLCYVPRTGEAGGCTSHPGTWEPFKDACAPSALMNARRQQEEGLLRLRRPNPPEATAPSPSPPSPPPSERTLWITPVWQPPKRGFRIRSLQQRPP